MQGSLYVMVLQPLGLYFWVALHCKRLVWRVSLKTKCLSGVEGCAWVIFPLGLARNSRLQQEETIALRLLAGLVENRCAMDCVAVKGDRIATSWPTEFGKNRAGLCSC